MCNISGRADGDQNRKSEKTQLQKSPPHALHAFSFWPPFAVGYGRADGVQHRRLEKTQVQKCPPRPPHFHLEKTQVQKLKLPPVNVEAFAGVHKWW
jgi:hypothetical protein